MYITPSQMGSRETRAPHEKDDGIVRGVVFFVPGGDGTQMEMYVL